MSKALRISVTVTVTVIVLTAFLSAGAQTTTRKRLKPVPRTEAPANTAALTAPADTLRGAQTAAAVTVTGYEKPLRATVETMFVANNTDSLIEDITLRIDYYMTGADGKRNLMHSRSVTQCVQIPPHQRRMVSLRSWDRNHVFYYRKNYPARTNAQATPYDVTVAVTAVTLRP